ncbi:hypothetical protein [Solimonas sp. SE-A11]|uniref:hypothetical protein n=1 Tax=Solimonas sp. SE-A11 TaxID=3054954 RepID=UPI00259D2F63|nr:hypothetical protein [Solimonas sp. SE-A11]MDM4772336.1 hypothetical protein [Solimonas sp. SE-A11]
MTDGDKLALATRLYVRLRHCTGRITDALWMTQNMEYAREIVRMARMGGDDELTRLADRFEEVIMGRPRAMVAASAAPPQATAEAPVSPATFGKYKGSLR